jgi:hypothetical protein
MILHRILMGIGILNYFSPVAWSAEGLTKEPTRRSLATEKNNDSIENKLKRSKKMRGRSPSEEDAQGSQAAKVFDKDLINKSKYELNGKPLEVDTE